MSALPQADKQKHFFVMWDCTLKNEHHCCIATDDAPQSAVLSPMVSQYTSAILEIIVSLTKYPSE